MEKLAVLCVIVTIVKQGIASRVAMRECKEQYANNLQSHHESRFRILFLFISFSKL